MSAANCVWHVPPVQGLDEGVVTVGRPVTLKCQLHQGSVPDFSQYYLKQPLAVPYGLRVFSVQPAESGHFDVFLTFYQAGEQLPDQVVLTNGEDEINLIGEPLTVQSVLKPTADGKPPEAYKAILPLNMTVPVVYYILFVLAMASAVIWIWSYVKRLHYYRQLKVTLKNYTSPLLPEDQFYKSLRLAEKKNYPLEDIERAFRVYVLRQYDIPMFDLSDKKALRYFRHNSPRHKKIRQELQKILQEFEAYRGTPVEDLESKTAFIKKLYKFIQLSKEVAP